MFLLRLFSMPTSYAGFHLIKCLTFVATTFTHLRNFIRKEKNIYHGHSVNTSSLFLLTYFSFFLLKSQFKKLWKMEDSTCWSHIKFMYVTVQFKIKLPLDKVTKLYLTFTFWSVVFLLILYGYKLI